MPLYPFYCKRCQKNFEIFLRPSEANHQVGCPYCKDTEVERFLGTEQDNLTPGVCGVQKES